MPAVGAALALAAMACGGPAAAAGCRLGLVDDLKVVNARGSPEIEAEINDQKVRLLIDSGAGLTTILHSAAAALHLPLIDVPGLHIYGVGGETIPYLASIKRMQIGGMTAASDVNLMVGGEGRVGPGVAGLVGWDLLSHWSVEFDLAHDAIRLLQTPGCVDAELAYWAKTYSETPFTSDNPDAPSIEVTVLLNGRPVRAILDSGASRSTVTPRAAQRVGASVDMAGAAETIHGVGAATVQSRVARFDSFQFGDEVVKPVKIEVADMFAADTYSDSQSRTSQRRDMPEMLLGADFVRAHRMLISPTLKLIVFTYDGGPLFDDRTQRQPPPSPSAEAQPPSAAH